MKYGTLKALWIRPALGLLATFLIATAAPAEVFCVTTSDELRHALFDAARNGEDDIIKIAVGTYAPGAGSFNYDSHVDGGDDRDLTVAGGWAEVAGDPCGQKIESPAFTVLDSLKAQRVMRLAIRKNSNLTVRSLTFRNGYVSDQSWGGGLEIYTEPNDQFSYEYAGRIIIENNQFMNNEAYNAGGLHIRDFQAIGNARLGVVNNTFVGNHVRNVASATFIGMHGGEPGISNGAGIYVTNNTIVDNTSLALNPPHFGFGSVMIRGDTPNLFVINNNMWGNDFDDLYVYNISESYIYKLQNNNIGNHAGRVPTSKFNNISVEPGYIPCSIICFSEWVPTVNSPLVDSGTHPGNFSPFWTMPAFDAAGNARVAQGTVDIGAYENHDRFFADRFE